MHNKFESVTERVAKLRSLSSDVTQSTCNVRRKPLQVKRNILILDMKTWLETRSILRTVQWSIQCLYIVYAVSIVFVLRWMLTCLVCTRLCPCNGVNFISAPTEQSFTDSVVEQMVKQRHDGKQCYRTVLQSVIAMVSYIFQWLHTCNRCPLHMVPMCSFSFPRAVVRGLFTLSSSSDVYLPYYLLSNGLQSSDSAQKAASSSACTGDVKCV